MGSCFIAYKQTAWHCTCPEASYKVSSIRVTQGTCCTQRCLGLKLSKPLPSSQP